MHLRKRIQNSRNVAAARRQNVTMGPNFSTGVGSVFWAPRSLVFGRDVHTGSYNRIEVDGTIGDGVLMGNSIAIIGKTDHAINEIGVPIGESTWVGTDPETLSQPVTIGADVWIGYGATILSGVTIGPSSIIGACSLVTKDVPPNTIVAGHPARIVRDRMSTGDLEAHWERLRQRGFHL